MKGKTMTITILDDIPPLKCKTCGKKISEREYNARDGVCRKCW